MAWSSDLSQAAKKKKLTDFQHYFTTSPRDCSRTSSHRQETRPLTILWTWVTLRAVSAVLTRWDLDYFKKTKTCGVTFCYQFCWQPTFLPTPENQRGLFFVPIIHRRQTFSSCIQTFQVWRRGRVKGCMLREATQTRMTQAQHPNLKIPNHGWWRHTPLIPELRSRSRQTFVSWRPVSSTERVVGQPGLHRETLSKEKKNPQKNKIKSKT